MMKGAMNMKPKNYILACVIIVLAVAIMESCVTRRKAISEEEFMSAWTGTWINEEYIGSEVRPRLVCRADGVVEFHKIATGSKHPHKHVCEILDHWIDSEGVVWYRAHSECLADESIYYELGKIRDSGNVLEFMWSVEGNTIEEWELDNDTYLYRIYYHE
jgi:hypothetical protein